MGVALRYYPDVDALTEHDCIVHAAPISHASGLFAPAFVAKAGNQIVPDSGGFDAEEIFALLNAWEQVTLFGAPTIVMRLADHPVAKSARIEHLRTLIYGGAPMYVSDLKRALAVFGPRLCNLYAQGETPVTGTYLSKAMHADVDHPEYAYRLSTVGIARTGIELRVVDEQDRDMPMGEVGEVVFRSDVTMAGYWNNPAATDEALRGGWLHTGDLGALDEKGFLTLRDRSNDLIISGGSNIYPREIEEVLLRSTAVAEASVVGRPHAEWGEEVVAFVVRKPGSSIAERELDELCLAHIARFKRPKAYVFVDSLPKSNYGKVLKTVLRKQLSERAG
jgi:acyl-CoA synthetase (AMP-forming)/AMP-acid ligase II